LGSGELTVALVEKVVVPKGPDIREVVDRLLEAEKRLTGIGEWREERPGVFRFTRAVEFGGEVAAELTIKAYPRRPQPFFRIVLAMSRAIWRVGFAPNEAHVNPRLNRFTDVSPPRGIIEGPHYHAWVDNRRFATGTSLPASLKLARFLPDRNRSFEQTLRWFCHEVGIEIGPEDVIVLPARDTLL
jgi:hypothetical protein